MMDLGLCIIWPQGWVVEADWMMQSESADAMVACFSNWQLKPGDCGIVYVRGENMSKVDVTGTLLLLQHNNIAVQHCFGQLYMWLLFIYCEFIDFILIVILVVGCVVKYLTVAHWRYDSTLFHLDAARLQSLSVCLVSLFVLCGEPFAFWPYWTDGTRASSFFFNWSLPLVALISTAMQAKDDIIISGTQLYSYCSWLSVLRLTGHTTDCVTLCPFRTTLARGAQLKSWLWASGGWALITFNCFVYLVCFYGRPNRLHYRSCPSIRLSLTDSIDTL